MISITELKSFTTLSNSYFSRWHNPNKRKKQTIKFCFTFSACKERYNVTPGAGTIMRAYYWALVLNGPWVFL